MALSSESLMRALGLNRHSATLYQRLLRQPGATLADLATGLDVGPEELGRRLEPLVEAGLVERRDDGVQTITPAAAIGRLLAETAAAAGRANTRLEELAAVLPQLGAPSSREEGATLEPLDGEVEYAGTPVAGLRRAIESGSGDLMWLRLGQWHLPGEEEMTETIAGAVRSGRRSRAIYPIRALSEDPGMIERRVEIGEQVRVLPELPTRLVIVGRGLAVLPEPLGLGASPRAVVRQPGLVEALTLLFEQLWLRAAPVPSADDGRAPDFQRRFLLEQLASGAQDEAIARRLSVSLRTVRRRVAELLLELGAESRFQAGVEAARRGWL